VVDGVFKISILKNESCYQNYLINRGIVRSASPVKISNVYPTNGIERIRTRIINRINSIYNNDTGNFLNSVLMGYRKDLDERLKEGFIHSGIIHMIAISGQHTAIFLLLINIILYPIPIPKKVKLTLSSVLILFYGFITYMNPPVMRAVIFIWIVNAGMLFQEKTDNENAVILTAFGMLMINRNNLHDYGFMLSFLAVYAIIQYRKHFASKNKAASLFLISFFIMLMTSPVMFSSFNYLSIGSPFMTVIILPIFNLIIPLGALSIAPGFSFISKSVDLLYLLMKNIVLLSEKAPFMIRGEIDAVLAVFLVITAIFILNKKGAAALCCSFSAIVYSIIRCFY